MTEEIKVSFEGDENLSAIAAKADKGIAKLEKGLDKVEKALEDTEKEARQTKRALEDVGEAGGFMAENMANAADSLATMKGNLAAAAIEFAVEKLRELAVAAAEFALEADKTRRSARGMLAEFADGPKEVEALFDGLQDMAKNLGGNVGDLSAEFVKLRREGKTAQEAIDLLKLQADVKAVKGSTEEAARAMDLYAEAIENGASHSEAIKQTAAALKVSGDGANASAASMGTLDGAMARAKATLEGALIKALDKAQPALEKLSEAIVKFAESGQLEDTLNAAADGMNFLAENGWILTGLFKVLSAAADPVGTAMDKVGGALDGLGKAFKGPIDAAKSALSSITGMVGGWVSAGGALVDGFVNGIKAKVKSAVAAAKSLGSEALASLKAVLKSSSPSKAAAEEGDNLSAGFEQGIKPVNAGANLLPGGLKASLPSASDAQVDAAPLRSAGSEASSGGITIETLTINATGASTPEDYVTLTRRAFVEAFNDMQLSRGVAV